MGGKMTKLLNDISQIIYSNNHESTKEYNFEYGDVTEAIMERNFKTLESLPIAYTYNEKYDEFAASIKKPISIEDLLFYLSEKDDSLFVFLNDCFDLLKFNSKSKQIPEFLFAACMINDITKLNTENINDLFLSLAHSPAYQNTELGKLRENITPLTKELNKDAALFEDSLINKKQIKNYLNIAFISNISAKNPSNWINYRDYSKINTSSIQKTSSLKDALMLLEKEVSTENAISVYNFLKENYLSSANKNSAGYCNSELERDYKASIMLASLIDNLGLEEKSEYQSIGYNLLARIKNIPAIIEEKYLLTQATSTINKFDKDAESLVREMLKGTLSFIDTDKTIISNIKETITSPITEKQITEQKYDDKETYTKKQLDSFEKIVENKLNQLAKTISILTKNINRKSNFEKYENSLDLLSEEFGVELTTIDEQPKASTRSHANTILLIDAINDRYDQLGRTISIFEKIRNKLKLETNIGDIEFDKKLLGHLTHICGNYQEQVIRDFYRLVDTDPLLHTNNKFRSKPAAITIAQLKERAWLTDNISKEFKEIIQASTLSSSQQEKYNQNKIYEKELNKNQHQQEEDIELILNI